MPLTTPTQETAGLDPELFFNVLPIGHRADLISRQQGTPVRTAAGCRETLALLHDKAARIAARIDALRAQDPHHHLIDQLTPALHDALSGIEKVGAELEALELPVIHQLAAE